MADEIGHLPRSPGRMWLAAKWSLQGLRAAWLHESSFRLEVYLLAVLGPLALVLGSNGVERALLLGSCLLVLAAELLNSAIEWTIDDISLEKRLFAKRAKDMGSAAVFMAYINCIVVWASSFFRTGSASRTFSFCAGRRRFCRSARLPVPPSPWRGSDPAAS